MDVALAEAWLSVRKSKGRKGQRGGRDKDPRTWPQQGLLWAPQTPAQGPDSLIM